MSLVEAPTVNWQTSPDGAAPVVGLRLAVVSLASPSDPTSWSGTPHGIVREIRRRFAHVNVVETPLADAVLNRVAGRFARIGLLPVREPAVSAWFGRCLERRLTALRPDVVVVIAAEPKVAALSHRWPMVVISDSFWENILDHYPCYAAVSRRIRNAGHLQQTQLLDRGAVILLSSQWAARTAAEAYDRPLSRFRVAPFGANFEPDRKPVIQPRDGGPLKLLFVGYDWVRKGGSLAAETFGLLRERYGDAELHIVGCQPPRDACIAGVHEHGRLTKHSPKDTHRLRSLFSEASFVFTPSRQEAYGLVFAEACAFGAPPVAVDTGGVGEIIRHGVNGLLLPPSATAADHAAAIASVWSDPVAYQAMRQAAREAFEDRLNWRSWGDALEQAIGQAMEA